MSSPPQGAALLPDDLVRGRYQIGDAEITLCTDGPFRLDGGAMFGVVPKALWQVRLPADEQNRVELGLNCAVVRTGRHTVVIETGLGNKQPPKGRAIFLNQERLPASLAAAGIAPESVDIVINTHLHFDHCGWNTTRHADGSVTPTFPNARYFVARGEVQHAHRQVERDRVSYISDNYDPLIRSGQMTLLDDDRIREDPEICPGVHVELFPGHTAHMMGVHITSSSHHHSAEHACFIGDLIPTTAHLDLTWGMSYDLDPLTVIEQRKGFYARAIPPGWLVLFPHDHGIPATRLVLDSRGRPAAAITQPSDFVQRP